MMAATNVAGGERSGSAYLIAGIVVASLTEALAGTLLAISRNDIMGDIHATPDEFAWLDVCYTAMKLTGFALAPWLLTRVQPWHVLMMATAWMGLAAVLAAFAARLDVLIILRLVQGLAGAILLVTGQALLFWRYAPQQQPVLQAIFAVGAVVAPATLVPMLQGWLVDTHNWTWIFFLVLPLGLVAISFLLIAGPGPSPGLERRALDGPALGALTLAMFSAAWLLSQGNRWDWLEEARVVNVLAIAVLAFLFVADRQRRSRAPLLDLALFRNDDFAFAFAVSFVAGAALFGSAFLIPAFALSVLGLTPTEAGALLLPSGVVFTVTLFAAALLIRFRGLAPVATVPFGILSVMIAMWMLSGSTIESGSDDMMSALLLRGFGLGCLFLSITLIAFSRLAPSHLAFGIGIFNIGRQLGGLMGVAGLQTLIDHQAAVSRTALGAALTPGSQGLVDRIAEYTAMLMARGMDPGLAAVAARTMLARTIGGQGGVIAFNGAFAAVALLFVAAVPVIVAVKVVLARQTARRLVAGMRR
jgi:DHA2 family multidrug resistance protein